MDGSRFHTSPGNMVNRTVRITRMFPGTTLQASVLSHPAGTSKDSDKCDLSNISDIKICIVGNGNIHIFKHPAYVSKDLGEIYI